MQVCALDFFTPGYDSQELLDALNRYGVVVFRNGNISPHEFIEFAGRLGALETAWEDRHPDYTELQLLDSLHRKSLNEKSSSQYWHSDRSFMKYPTRYTFLYAERVEGRPACTEFLSTSELAATLGSEWLIKNSKFSAVHSFSKNFPRIMSLKGVEAQKIEEQIKLYPEVSHPLVHDVSGVLALYYNELCIERILGASRDESDRVMDSISKAMLDLEPYVHNWATGDMLVWDNFTTVHRGGAAVQNGRRRLLRATVGVLDAKQSN